jgi:hypothetical protein
LLIIVLKEEKIMKEKLTLEERYKFLRKIKKSYQKAGKKEKGRILNMVKKITGLHRKD